MLKRFKPKNRPNSNVVQINSYNKPIMYVYVINKILKLVGLPNKYRQKILSLAYHLRKKLRLSHGDNSDERIDVRLEFSNRREGKLERCTDHI